VAFCLPFPLHGRYWTLAFRGAFDVYRRIYWIILLLLSLAVMPATAQDNADRPFEGVTLRVLSHDSFAFSERVLVDFEAETGMTVELLRAGDTGTMVNQAILSKNNPLADVLFGIDNTFLTRALDEDIFIPYESPLLETVPDTFILDPEHRVTPIDYGDVALNYDIAYFEENDIPVPTSLADLTDEAYTGLLVVQNPATSSPGLAFLMATVSEFGEDGDYTYLDYWTDLRANDVLIVEDWTTAYYSEFTLAGGDRPLVVSYASSPPAEVLFADPPVDSAVTGSVVADGTAFRQIEFAGILAGTENEAAAQAFIDFLLSVPFQEDMPLNMFVFPVNTEAELPEVFVEYTEVAENPAELPFAEIEANRESWIQAWTETVIR
jgi:thiamine transport system substrate-binding protein